MDTQIIHADCKEALKDLIEKGIQVDSIVTDPPYELNFMGKAWDNTGIAYDKEFWQLALQVLKPGGHLLAFSATRTSHKMACAIEDAGFEIRDCISWVYGQGFPKSLDVGKAIGKMAGAEREVVGPKIFGDGKPCHFISEEAKLRSKGRCQSGATAHSLETRPSTDAAKQWDGWGSALKPAHEPITLARKPLSEKNIASNVIKHGTGGINIGGCKILINKENETDSRVGTDKVCGAKREKSEYTVSLPSIDNVLMYKSDGRYPANLIHDGSDEVEAEFAKYKERKGGTGTASRFFYSAKASKKDRVGSKHPTVKPISLMRYLCRLITPPGGTVLDPFAGSGTTGQAALEEGFKSILIEKEEEYINDIKKRMQACKLPLGL